MQVIHVHLPDVMLSEGEVLVASQGQGHVADAELPSALGTFASSIGAAEPKAADGVSAAPEVVRLLVSVAPCCMATTARPLANAGLPTALHAARIFE
jgi:hypothetical protein